MPRGDKYYLDQGVNLSDPIKDLAKGELRLARNSYYLPESRHLVKVHGPTTAGSTGSSSVRGLGFSRFRTAGSFLVAAAGTSYYSAPLGSTTWTARATGLTSVGLMEAAYAIETDRLYVCDGVNAMRTWAGSGNMRAAGLSRPSNLTVTFLSNGTTIYPQGTTVSYCHTEVDDSTDTSYAIESAPSEPQSVFASAANGTFKIVFPTATNAAKTKYRVYRTQHGGTVFFLAAEIDGASTRYYDGTNTEGGGHPDNTTVYGTGFSTLDDLFLASLDVIPQVMSGQRTTYVTTNGVIPIGDIFGIWKSTAYIAGVASFPHHLYFSLPGFPECFPPTNFIPVGIDRGEPITACGPANDRLLIFTQNSIHRLSAFPQPSDPGYGIGTASLENVTSDHGCVAKRTVINFGVGQPNNKAFYLSARGPMMTDGYETWPLNQDIPWTEQFFNLGAMSGAIARCNHRLQQIWLFVPSRNSGVNDIALVYHYHPAHMKYGAVGKWTLPVHVYATAATTAYDSVGRPQMYVGRNQGTVYQLDNGSSDAQAYEDSAGNINWEWTTGDEDYGEASAKRNVKRVFLNMIGGTEFAGSMTVEVNHSGNEQAVELSVIEDHAPETMTLGTSTIDFAKGRQYRVVVQKAGTQHQWHMQESSTQERQLVSIEVELEEQGRQN